MKTAVPLTEMLEKEWHKQVVELASLHGWKRTYHTHDSRRSEPGWPDLALVRDRLILLELKREQGKTSEAQRAWLTTLSNAQVEVYVCRPRHLEDLSQVLHARGPRVGWTAAQREARNVLLDELHQHFEAAP